MSDKVIISCALTGVLTDPKQHPVPVTPEEMAREAKAAYDAGATVMHCPYPAAGTGPRPSAVLGPQSVARRDAKRSARPARAS